MKKEIKRSAEYFTKKLVDREHKVPWILLQGEPNSGKTTCMYYLLSSHRMKTYPHSMFNLIDVSYGKNWFKLMDIDAEMQKDESIKQFFMELADGIVYVIDADSPEKLKESIEPFHEALQNIPSDIPMLIIINQKQTDVEIDIEEVLNLFDLTKISSPAENRSFHFEVCNLMTGEGVYSAFDWFISKLTAVEEYHETVSIHRILIYDINGLLAYDALFSDIINTEHDAVLITGLLSALNSVSKNLFRETSNLDVVSIGDYSLVLFSREAYICTLLIERGGSYKKAKQIAEMILEIYLENGEAGRQAIKKLVMENQEKNKKSQHKVSA
jgi:GTPase SAR1 family protein